MKTFPLSKGLQVLMFLFLVFAGLYYARPFLAPFSIALLLAMLFLPVTRKLENRGISKGFAAFLSTCILAVVIAGIVVLVSTQIAGLAEDFPKLKGNVNNTITKIEEKIVKITGISKEQQQQMLEQQKSSGGGKSSATVTAILGSITSILVDTVLVFVYIFLLLYFRTHLKNFILKLVPGNDKDKAATIVEQASNVAVKYLTGLGTMIVMLWVMYGIGFSIVGVKNGIFFAILCGLLEIIPFVGNITGTGLTIIMALTQGGGSGIVIGILVTYAIVQFVQTYILEPLIVGSEVNINPLFTILVIVIGELVWGVPGMILAIPILGIIKVICDHIEPLKPFGFLVGQEKKKDNKSLLDKIKGAFHFFT